MATGEAYYSEDYACDPEMLARARVYGNSQEDPSGVLCGMIGAVLAERPIQEVFPDTPLSESTEYFLQSLTHYEIEFARVILGQWDLFGDIPALAASLSNDLPVGQKLQFKQAVAGVAETCGQASTDMLLRKLNGEPSSYVALDYHIKPKSVNYQSRHSFVRLCNSLDDSEEIIGNLTRRFPVARPPAAHSLTPHLDEINYEVTHLGRRMDRADIRYLARLATVNVSGSENLCDLLCFINTQTHSRVVSRYGRPVQNSYLSVYKYDEHGRDFISSLRPRPVAPASQPRLPAYENTEEATQLLHEVLALPRQQPLSKEQQKEAARDIEVGLVAERAAERLQAQAELSVKDEEELQLLLELIAEGKSAMQSLLSSHRRYVEVASIKHAIREPKLLREDLEMAGMRAVLRAVRKYDFKHASDMRFTSYAHKWIREFLWQYVYKESWNVSGHTGRKIMRIIMARSRLATEIQGEVSSVHIAADVGLAVTEVDELLALFNNARNGDLKPQGDVGPAAVEKAQATTRLTFEFETRQALERVLAGHPRALQVLEMHIAANAPLTEVAEVLQIPLEKTQALLQTAFATIAAHQNSKEMHDLLTSERTWVPHVPLSHLYER